MNRRELLGTVGARATGMAGLFGAREAGQDTGTATTASDGQEVTGIESSADRPFATISVGTRAGVRNPENNRPHAVRVWNDSGQARPVGLRLTRGDDAGPVALDRRVEFPADGYLTLRLLEPADYALAVRPSDESTAGVIEIPRSQFDCNESRTNVRVAADGGVGSVTISTEEGCPPAVVERTFTAFRGTCGSADDAGVSFGAESVEVSGSIRAPNPCYGARLVGVAVPSTDALRVTVATAEPTADICAQCIGTVEYVGHLRFRDRVPGTVEVVHRRDGESAVVASAIRGSETPRDGAGGERTTTPTGAGNAGSPAPGTGM